MHQKGVKMTKIVPIRHSSDQLDIADALDGEIDTMWGQTHSSGARSV